jgi:hypothetical protein
MSPTDTASPPGSATTPTQATGSGGALVRSTGSDISAGVFSGIAAFEAAQRMAQCLCSSTMVPPEYRGQQGLANSLIALEIAGRMGLSPLVVMQNMTPIHGRPSWSSSFLIATVNASGRFSPLRFQFDDEENPSWCYAEASDRATGETLKGEKVSVAMAKREGWWSRKDRNGNETSKWQSMTGQMLRYRAASFWVRVYCPEMSLGLMSQEEMLDAAAPASVVQAVTVQEVSPSRPSSAIGAVPQPLHSAPVATTVTPSDANAVPHAKPAVTHHAAESSGTQATEPLEQGGAEEAEAQVEPTPRPRRNSRVRRSPSPAEEGAAADEPAAPSPAAPAAEAPTGETTSPEPTLTPQLPAEQSLFAAPLTVATEEPAAAVTASPPAAEVAAVPNPTGEPPAQSDPTAAEVISTGVREIPRITSLEALDGAKARVNGLLASGRINEEGAERLWAVIDRRRQELLTTSAAAEVAQ